MALKNFMRDGSYARIERVNYSKHEYRLSGDIVVYADDTAATKLFETHVTINTNNCQFSKVDRIISTEETLYMEAPEFSVIREKENVLIEIPKDLVKSDYGSDINNSIISKVNGKLKFLKYQYIKKTDGNFYVIKNGVYELLEELVLPEQFSRVIDPENILKSFYSYIKTLPVYSECVDA